MKVILRHTLFSVILLLILCTPGEVRACSCLDYDVPVCTVYWNSDAVFTGSVIKVTPDTAESWQSVIRLKVDEAYRLVGNKPLAPGDEVEVLAPEQTSCKMGFEVGQQWLIYADRTSDGRLATGPCGRSNQFPAEEDLAYIRALSEKSPAQSILGRVGRSKYDPLEGVKVIIEDRSSKHKLVTDKEGKFKIDLPQPGTYKVRLFIPYSAYVVKTGQVLEEVESHPTEELTTAEYDVTVPAGRCDYSLLEAVEKDLKATASIGGKVLDNEDRPVAGQTVYLYQATQGQDFSGSSSQFVYTDKSGNYQFEGLREGRYWVGINLGDIPEVHEPYPATLYPGVQDINKATPITLKQGEQLSKKDIKLPPKLIEREVTGSIVWPDGRPALAPPPGAAYPGLRPDIHVRDPNRLWYPINPRAGDRRVVEVDDGGHFSFVGLEGLTYVISASAYDNEEKAWHSKAMKLTIRGDMMPLVLKLTLPGGGDSKEMEKELGEKQ